MRVRAQQSLRDRPFAAYGRGVGLLRHRHSNKRSKISRVGRHFPRVPPRESFLLQLLQARREVADATELDNTDIDYNNIQNKMSDSRRSPTSTPRSGGRGPATRPTTRSTRARARAPESDPAYALSGPRGPGKGPKGKGKPPGATSGSGETRRTPYQAKKTRVQDLGTPSGRALARGARAQHTADNTDTAANSAAIGG